MQELPDQAWIPRRRKYSPEPPQQTNEKEEDPPTPSSGSREGAFATVNDTQCLEVSFSLSDVDIERMIKSPEMAFNAVIKRRKAEVKVSTLSTEQRRRLVEANDTELNTWLKYSVVTAASREGISPSALMKMRWVVTINEDGRL